MKIIDRTINGTLVRLMYYKAEHNINKLSFQVLNPETGERDEELTEKLLSLCHQKSVKPENIKESIKSLFDRMRTIVGNDPVYYVKLYQNQIPIKKTKFGVRQYIRQKNLTTSDIESIIPDRGKHKDSNVVSHFFNTERSKKSKIQGENQNQGVINLLKNKMNWRHISQNGESTS